MISSRCSCHSWRPRSQSAMRKAASSGFFSTQALRATKTLVCGWVVLGVAAEVLGVDLRGRLGVVQRLDRAAGQLRDGEVGQAQAGVGVAARDQVAEVLEVGDDQLVVTAAGAQVEAAHLLGVDAPDQRDAHRGERRDLLALRGRRGPVASCRGGRPGCCGRCCTCRRRWPAPGRLGEVGHLVGRRGDDVGVPAGVDAELVPRRGGEDLDAGLLLHLLLDALVLEPLPDRVRRHDHVDDAVGVLGLAGLLGWTPARRTRRGGDREHSEPGHPPQPPIRVPPDVFRMLFRPSRGTHQCVRHG